MIEKTPKPTKKIMCPSPHLKKEQNKMDLFYSYWVTLMNVYKILMWLVWLNTDYSNE